MAYESGVAWLRDRRLLARRVEPTRSRANVVCARVNSPVYAGDAGAGDLERFDSERGQAAKACRVWELFVDLEGPFGTADRSRWYYST